MVIIAKNQRSCKISYNWTVDNFGKMLKTSTCLFFLMCRMEIEKSH